MSDSRKKRRVAPKGEFDPRKWAHPIFAIGGFLGAWVLSHAIDDIWAIVWGYYPQYVSRPSEMTANLVGIGIALALTVYAWRREDWFKFTTEVVTEVAQVVWPTKAETRGATIVVIVISLLCSLLLFGMDQIWSTLTSLLYGN